MIDTFPEAVLRDFPEEGNEALDHDLEINLHSLYQEYLVNGEHIYSKSRFRADAAYLQVTVGNEDAQDIFELKIENQKDPGINGGLANLIDFASGILDEFFHHQREAFLPMDFVKKTFMGHELYVRHSKNKPGLETQADDLLAKK